MKQFNLEEAKKGRKVCTRAGLPVRIICFDAKNEDYPIIALIDYADGERPVTYTTEGRVYIGDDSEIDLVLATEKNEGWINLYSEVGGMIVPGFSIFLTKEEAIKNSFPSKVRVDTIKIEWEE